MSKASGCFAPTRLFVNIRENLPDLAMVPVPTSRKFQSGPVEIAYLDEGADDPIMLIHGFASNKETNWVHPGWVRLASLRAGSDPVPHSQGPDPTSAINLMDCGH